MKNQSSQLFTEVIKLYDLYKSGGFTTDDGSDSEDSYSE